MQGKRFDNCILLQDTIIELRNSKHYHLITIINIIRFATVPGTANVESAKMLDSVSNVSKIGIAQERRFVFNLDHK